MSSSEAQKQLGKPIARYSKFEKPKGFEKLLETLHRDQTYNNSQNFYVIPTDSKASKQPQFDEDMQMFAMQVEAHRVALGMKTEDPVVILRSSISLRDLYAVTVSFCTNPMTFMQTPLEQLPSIEQQLFEDRLIYSITHLHPFLTFVYSTSFSEFFLLFNIPIPTNLNQNGNSKADDKDNEKTEPATLAYLRPCINSVQQLSRFYPTASRPIVVTNSFPERISTSTENTLTPFNGSCSNLRCSKTQLQNPSTEFMRCTACRLVMYCSKGLFF